MSAADGHIIFLAFISIQHYNILYTIYLYNNCVVSIVLIKRISINQSVVLWSRRFQQSQIEQHLHYLAI